MIFLKKISNGIKNAIVILFYIIPLLSSSQLSKWLIHETNGQLHLVDFSTPSPTVSLPSPGYGVTGLEDVNLMTDSSGNILFSYFCNSTGSLEVRDRSWNVMPNGNGILGHSSSLKSCIVKIPCTSDKYYIVHLVTGGVQELYYSIVDMSANGGLGDVVQSNISLGTGFCEGLSISHQMINGCRWLFCSKAVGNTLEVYRFLVSNLSIGSMVSMTTINSAAPTLYQNDLKISPNNNKIVISTFQTNPASPDIVVWDFDLNSGTITNRVDFNVSSQPVFGIEFSPNNQNLYWRTYLTTDNTELGRVNLSSGIVDVINTNFGRYGTAIETASNGRFYCSHNYNIGYLSEIANPDAVNIALIGFTFNSVLISANGCRPGVPNVISGEIPGTSVIPTYIDFSAASTPNCNEYMFMDSTCLGTWWEWSFGDGTTSNLEFPTHHYSSSGTFDVQLRVIVCSDTLSLMKPGLITISNGFNIQMASTNAACGGTLGTATANPSGGISPYQYSWNTIPVQNTQTATNLQPGVYTVLITDSSGCIATDSITVNGGIANPFAIQSTPAACLANDGSVTVTHNGGTGSFSYNWNPSGDTLSPVLTGVPAGVYSVIVTDLATGCTQSLSTVVGNTAGIAATITSAIDATCALGEDGSATVAASGGQPPYFYLWPNGDTTTTTNHLTSGTHIVRVEDYNGCPAFAQVTIGFTNPSPIIELGPDSNPCIGTPYNIDAGGGYASYLWSDNSTNQTLNVTSSGIYSVIVTNNFGCENFDAISVNFVNCFFNNIQNYKGSESDVIIYPNPTSGKINVSINEAKQNKFTLKITDLLGQIVVEDVVFTVAGNNIKEIDLGNLNQGVYFLDVQTDNSVVKILRIIVE